MSKPAILVTTLTVIVVAAGLVLSEVRRTGKLPGGKWEIAWWAMAIAAMVLIVFVPFN